GYNNGGVIENCESNTVVKGNGYIGGICGYNNGIFGGGIIENCKNISGVTGYCVASSESIRNNNILAGGIVGYNSGSIIECENAESANINGRILESDEKLRSYDIIVGGICGENNGYLAESASINNCINSALVVGSSSIYADGDVASGGICGISTKGTVSNCRNNGEVDSSSDSNILGWSFAGGICGECKGSVVSICENVGSVIGGKLKGATGIYNYSGGICGYNCGEIGGEDIIKNCLNSGEVIGCSGEASNKNGNYAGGISGFCNGGISGSSLIDSCYNIGNVSGAEWIGGICGYMCSCKLYTEGECQVNNCYYLENSALGGINGDNKTESTICKTETEFESGEVTYLLNKGVNDGTQIWYQTIGTDTFPEFSGKTVCALITDDVASVFFNKSVEVTVPNTLKSNAVTFTDGSNYIAPNEKIKSETDIILTSVIFNISMQRGASFRIDSQTGIRFYTNIDRDLVSSLEKAGYTVKLGTLITPNDKLGVIEFNHMLGTNGVDYIDVEYNSRDYYEENDWSGMVGSIIKIREENITRDFIGRGYIKVSKDEFSTTVYADYLNSDITNNIRNIAFLANELKMSDEYNNFGQSMQSIIDNYASFYKK
ncbi:MAG: hypothetical protein ACI39F_06315, partial [Acutalibacteraceae bacterium]